MADKLHGLSASLAVSTDGSTDPYELCGSFQDLTFNVNRAESDATAYDDGSYMDYVQGHIDATADLTFVWDRTDGELQQIIDSQLGSPLYYRYRKQTLVDAPEWTFQANVTSVVHNSSRQDTQTVSVTLRIKGAFSKAAQT